MNKCPPGAGLKCHLAVSPKPQLWCVPMQTFNVEGGKSVYLFLCFLGCLSKLMSQHFARAESLFLYAALPRPSSSLAAILAFLTLMSASPETQCRFRTASTGRQNTLNLYNGSRVNRAPSHLLSFTSLMGLAPSSFIFMGGK